MTEEQLEVPTRLAEECVKELSWKDEGWKETKSFRVIHLRDYEVKIRFLTIGCIVSVGCKEIPFTTIKEGMKALNDYVDSPFKTRKIWEEKFDAEEE
jgi:hypothetical protein